MYQYSTWDSFEKFNPDTKGGRKPWPRRFPREPLENRTMMQELLFQFPAPLYNPRKDGATNPADDILSWATAMSEECVQQACVNHGLSSTGNRWDCIKRIWRHWRAARLEIGFPKWGYGPEFERVGPTNCVCGKVGVDSMKVKRFPRSPNPRFPRAIRFPREEKPTRFPRLAKDDPQRNDPIWMLRPVMNGGK